MGTEIKELYNALQRFIERRQKMHIPLERDDDDIMIANSFDELEQLRSDNKRLREQINTIIFDHALRDESPSKPVLALWDQPLIIKELIGALEGGSD